MREYLDLLIKPASGRCNMRCAYCFYEDVASRRSAADRGFMSEDTLEEIVRKAFAETRLGVSFAFQGGEPTLRGLDFFRRFVVLLQQYNTKQIPVNCSIQTNGLLLDDAWCAFLSKNHFLVGLSVDGPAALHDRFRKDAGGNGTHQRVLETAHRLTRHGVEFNILCVVTNTNAENAEMLYRWFKENDFSFLQFIPSIADFGACQTDDPKSLTAARYGLFLQQLFDLWLEDFKAGRYISIRHLDNWIGMLLGRAPESCAMRGTCSAYACIEADGSVYPCDFYVLDEHLLGNIHTDDFSTMLNSDVAHRFMQTSLQLPDMCKQCHWFPLCRGGCRRNREAPEQANVFCSAYKTFFSHALPGMQEAVRLLQSGTLYC